MTGAQQSSTSFSAGRQAGEPDDRRFLLTTGVDLDLRRPGGMLGSRSGGVGDLGREGLAGLGVDLQAVAPHTGY